MELDRGVCPRPRSFIRNGISEMFDETKQKFVPSFTSISNRKLLISEPFFDIDVNIKVYLEHEIAICVVARVSNDIDVVF